MYYHVLVVVGIQCSFFTLADPVGDFPNASLTLTTKPVGNGWPTMTALNIEGHTEQDHQREFLVNVGLLSNTGANASSTPYRDKVAIYAATRAVAGTGDVWAMNPLVTQEPGSGEYAAQGIELDFNNNNAHRGDADAGAGLAFPVSYGLSVTGAGKFRSTSAMLVCGNKDMWNRGITFANDAIAQSTFQDLGNPHKSVDIRGAPKFGIYQSNAQTQNYFRGEVVIGGPAPDPDPNNKINTTNTDTNFTQFGRSPSIDGNRKHEPNPDTPNKPKSNHGTHTHTHIHSHTHTHPHTGPPPSTASPTGYQLRVEGKALSSGGWVKADADDICSGARCWKKLPHADTPAASLMDLTPRMWSSVGGDDPDAEIGLIAQEVEEVLPSLVRSHIDPVSGRRVRAVSYERVSALLLRTYQQQQRVIDQQTQVIAELTKQMASLAARVEELATASIQR